MQLELLHLQTGAAADCFFRNLCWKDISIQLIGKNWIFQRPPAT